MKEKNRSKIETNTHCSNVSNAMFPFKGINCKSQCHESKDFFDSYFDRVSTWKTGRNDFPKPKVLLIAMISGVKFENNKEVSSEYCYWLSIMYPT